MTNIVTRIIKGKRRLTSLVAIMAVISLVIIGLTLSFLYDTTFEQERHRLIDIVKGQASLIRAVALYDQEAEPRMKEENPEHDAFEATLSQLREAHENFRGFGETGEFTLARLDGDQIVFVLNHRHHDLDPFCIVPMSSPNAEPMKLALSGESGSVVGPDYRGEQVLAAYEPVKELGLGIVAKVDISEIREPFIQAGLILVGMAIVLIFFGAMLLILISKPIISDVIERDARLRDITSTMPGVVFQFVLYKDGSFSMPYLSDTNEKVTGFKTDILKQDASKIHEFIHANDQLSFRESVLRSADTMTPWDHEFRIETPGEEIIWINGRSNPSLLPDGSICWNGVLTNITERKQAEEALRESELWLRSIFDVMSDGLLVVAPDRTIINLNPAIEKTFGYTTSELVGHSTEILHVDHEHYVEFGRRIQAAFDKGEEGSFEFEAKRKNGQVFSTEHTVSLLKNDDGQSFGIVSTVRDITERKQAEEILPNLVEATSFKYGSAFFDSMAVQLSKALNADYALIGELSENNDQVISTIAVVADGKLVDNFTYELAGTPCANVVGHTICCYLSGIVDEFPDDKLLKDMGVEGYIGMPLFDSQNRPLGLLAVLYRKPIVKAEFKEAVLQIFSSQIGSELERTRSDKALVESEEKLREAQYLSRIGDFTWDIVDGGTVCSDGLYALLMRDRNETMDFEKVSREMLHPDDLDRVVKWLRDSMASGEEILPPNEYRLIQTSGEIIWVQTEGRFEIQGGKPTRLFGICQDITERKQAEEAREQARAFMQTVIDGLPDNLIVIDRDFKVVLSNLAIRQSVGGADPADACLTCHQVYYNSTTPCQGSGEVCALKQVLATKAPVTIEHVRYNAEGKATTVEIMATPIFDREGEVVQVIELSRDISETKRLRKLESRAERLETAGVIAGQVAHDFNNLLAPIIAYPEFIREELPPDSEALQFLEAIENAGEKIANINQDLLTMGRRGHYNQEVLDLNRVVLQATNEMKSLTKTVNCEFDLSQELMKIKGGVAQIHRVLTNLLTNAQDAMGDAGQITIKTENYYADDTAIEFGRVPKGEYVKLTVSDNGCGIPDDLIKKILDPFFTTKSTNKKRGSGLGLSVVDAVMKDHHGYLNVTSKVGEGTSFYLYFPITREDFDENEFDSLVGGPEKILVVDDDEIQLKVARQLLTKLGYKVETVQSGEKAIEFLQKDSRDLVILDMVMPSGIDGTETYRRILEINPNQKAIILSGYSELDRVLEVQKLGAGAFVRKPVSRKVIAAAVRKELDRPVGVMVS